MLMQCFRCMFYTIIMFFFFLLPLILALAAIDQISMKNWLTDHNFGTIFKVAVLQMT